MDEKIAAALRAPFAPELIGKRPQPNCKQCKDAQNKVCGRHRYEKCDECGQWGSSGHTHLDYVGHADITDRLLSVDPDWSWEPVQRDVNQQVLAAAVATGNPEVIKAVLDAAPPMIGPDGALWIYLTVAGVTRRGFGDAQGKRGPNAVKEAIGDALRNAAMRFGVGLDMWRKEVPDTDSDQAKPEPAEARTFPNQPAPPARPATDLAWLKGMEARIAEASTPDELDALAHEMSAKKAAGEVTQADYDPIWQHGLARFNEMNGVSA